MLRGLLYLVGRRYYASTFLEDAIIVAYILRRLEIKGILGGDVSEGRLSVADIVNLLPQKLQLRFNSLGSYVQGVIEEEQGRLGRDFVLDSEDIQLIQLSAFIYSLDSFMRSGTRAASNASVVFEQFGLYGFEVGSTQFTRNNSNTLRGRRLADELRSFITNTPLNRYIVRATSMRDLIARIVRDIRDGEALDQQ